MSSIMRTVILVVLFLSGCTSVIYQGRGHYPANQPQSKEVMLQWKAQKYYIPFFTNQVDYGSVSVQAEKIPDLFLDYENHQEYGLVFKERRQDFRLIDQAPEIRIGNYIVCAKLKDRKTLDDVQDRDVVTMLVFCEPKPGAPEIVPPTLEGYKLDIMESKKEENLP